MTTSEIASTIQAQTAERERTQRRRLRPGKERSNILTVAMFACALYFLLPLVWLVISSTKSNSDLFSTFGYWFAHDFNLFNNIADVFSYQGGVFWQWLL